MKQAGVRRFQLYRVSTALLGAGLVILMAALVFAQESPQRDVFFGETHVHTSWSFDAYIFGNTKTGPANLSDGSMFPMEVDFKGRPIDATWAEARMRNERLQEIKQIKGQSETTPMLSPDDDFANFEVLSYLLGDPAGRVVHEHGSYIREALRNGLGMAQARGYNPIKLHPKFDAEAQEKLLPHYSSTPTFQSSSLPSFP